MLPIDEKQTRLKAELAGIRDSQERLAYIVARGRLHPPLEASLKRDEFLVEGCLAKLWFVPTFHEGKCFFQADSDSAIVKGIASLICDLYSGSSPAEILAYNASFLAEAGVIQHLTANRRNSVGRLNEKIRGFAAAQLPASTAKT